MPTTTTAATVVAFDPTRLNIFTAREWLSETEPGTLELLLDPHRNPKTGTVIDQAQALAGVDTALAGDTEKAAKIAREGGFPFNAQGRYPMLVWMVVYP